MKTMGVYAFMLILVGCASASSGPSLSAENVARLMAVNDNLIVPGERMGPIFIGMTETELYQKLGNPSKTVRGQAGTWIAYEYGSIGLSSQVDPATHRVNVVDNFGFYGEHKVIPYHTEEGITLGSSELRVQTLPWKLAWKISEKLWPHCWHFQYTGIRISTCDGSVIGITVFEP